MKPSKSRKIILAVAPVGRSTKTPAINPLTPKQVAEEVIRCARAGALGFASDDVLNEIEQHDLQDAEGNPGE